MMTMSQDYRSEITALCLVCILFSGSFSLFIVKATQDAEEPFLKFEVNNVYAGYLNHSINITNPSAQNVQNGELIVPLIRNETARHQVAITNISSTIGQPFISNDSSGNIYAHWKGIELNRNQSLTVTINYSVLSFSVRYLIDENRAYDYNTSSDLYKKYTEPEPLIQSDNSTIISKAHNVTEKSTTIPESVSKIYSFVTKHLRYAIQEEEKGAVWALENGVGDCSEYSYLFVALCRAIGIPARVQAGFAFHYSSETLEDGHMWAEYYLENYGWIPVDATWQLFNMLDSRHFSAIGSIPEDTTYANYVFNTPADVSLEDAQAVELQPYSSAIIDSVFAKNAKKAAENLNQAKIAAFIGKTLGAYWVFSSEVTHAEQNLLESKILLQEAIEQLSETKATECFQKASQVTQELNNILIKISTLYISIALIIMISVLLIFWCKTKR